MLSLKFPPIEWIFCNSVNLSLQNATILKSIQTPDDDADGRAESIGHKNQFLLVISVNFLEYVSSKSPFSPLTAYHDSGWLTHPVELLIYCQVKWKLYKSLLLLVVNNTVSRIVCHITGFNEERPSDVVECHLFTCILTQRCLLTRDCVLQRLQRYCEEVQPSVKWW